MVLYYTWAMQNFVHQQYDTRCATKLYQHPTMFQTSGLQFEPIQVNRGLVSGQRVSHGGGTSVKSTTMYSTWFQETPVVPDTTRTGQGTASYSKWAMPKEASCTSADWTSWEAVGSETMKAHPPLVADSTGELQECMSSLLERSSNPEWPRVV